MNSGRPIDPDRNPGALRGLGVGYTVLGFTYMGLVFVLNGRGIVPIPQDGTGRWVTLLILGIPALMFFQTGGALRRRAGGDQVRIPTLLLPFLLGAVAIIFTIVQDG